MSGKTKLGLEILIAAAILGLLGDLLLRATPWGVNVGIWVLALVGLAAALMVRSGVEARGQGRWLVAPLIVFAAFFAWRDSNTLAVINGLALLAALSGVVLRSGSGRIAVSGLLEYVFWGFQTALEYVFWGFQTALFAFAGILPTAVRDVGWRELRGGGYAPLFAVLRGLAIAAPLLLLFGTLFVAADAVFEDLVSNLFDFDLAEAFGHVLLFAGIAWASAGLLRLAIVDGELPTPGERPAFLRLGIVEVGVVLGLLDALFLAFVLVQVRYFFGGAGQVLGSDGLTYAEYARRGFFELVNVTALVLPILLLAHWLLRSGKPWHSRLFRFLAGLLVSLLFVVMASALQRMRLYTAEFGLTELRLYTTAFMVWVLTVLILFILTVLRDRRDRFAFGALVTGFLAVATLNAINPDALIVRTNVARHEAGKQFDTAYLASLSADAVPALTAALPKVGQKRLPAEVTYTPEGEQKIQGGPTLQTAVEKRWKATDTDWRTYSISRARASGIVAFEPE